MTVRRCVCRGVLLCVWIVGLTTGCVSQTKRLDPDESRGELGTGPTSQDLRSIAQRMARSLIALPQIQNARTPPTVAFVSVENRSDEYIDGDMLLRMMRTLLIKHSAGHIRFLDRALAEQIARENRAKALGRLSGSPPATPYGADYLLTGVIDSHLGVLKEGHTNFLRFSFRLTDAATSVIIWEDAYVLKKASILGILYR